MSEMLKHEMALHIARNALLDAALKRRDFESLKLLTSKDWDQHILSEKELIPPIVDKIRFYRYLSIKGYKKEDLEFFLRMITLPTFLLSTHTIQAKMHETEYRFHREFFSLLISDETIHKVRIIYHVPSYYNYWFEIDNAHIYYKDELIDTLAEAQYRIKNSELIALYFRQKVRNLQ